MVLPSSRLSLSRSLSRTSPAFVLAHIVRGLRATSDFEYEFQIDAVNRHLDNSLRTVYFMASPGHSFLSSSNVKEIGLWGGSIKGLVPAINEDIIRERLARK